MNYNSVVNQDIKSKFVERNVITNMNEVIQHLLSSGSYGDYEHELLSIQSTPNYENAADYGGFYFDEVAKMWVSDKDGNEEIQYTTAQEVCEGENLDYDYTVAYEFWAVSNRLGEQLKEHGEMVQHILGHMIWGRCTTGQAILLDNCISEICEEMEILEGQKYDWSK